MVERSDRGGSKGKTTANTSNTPLSSSASASSLKSRSSEGPQNPSLQSSPSPQPAHLTPIAASKTAANSPASSSASTLKAPRTPAAPSTPTPASRPRTSSSQSSLRPEYRYSLGPKPVRFPRESDNEPTYQPPQALGTTLSMSSDRSRSPSADLRAAKRSKVDPDNSTGKDLLKTPRPPLGVAGEQSRTNSQDLLTARPSAAPRRPSSRILTLTTFPFPHPTTPKGSADEQTKLLGFTIPHVGVMDRMKAWFGGRTPDRRDADDEAEAADTSRPTPTTPGLSRSRSYGTVASSVPQTAANNRLSHFHQPSPDDSLDSHPDITDPYGYRRLAGPDLLPTYHAEHVEPRRKRRKGRWGKVLLLGGVADDQVRERSEAARTSRGVFWGLSMSLLLALTIAAIWWWFFVLARQADEGRDRGRGEG
ncbi:unnamed protein product [Jaminaea pallidilutea]